MIVRNIKVDVNKIGETWGKERSIWNIRVTGTLAELLTREINFNIGFHEESVARLRAVNGQRMQLANKVHRIAATVFNYGIKYKLVSAFSLYRIKKNCERYKIEFTSIINRKNLDRYI